MASTSKPATASKPAAPSARKTGGKKPAVAKPAAGKTGGKK